MNAVMIQKCKRRSGRREERFTFFRARPSASSKTRRKKAAVAATTPVRFARGIVSMAVPACSVESARIAYPTQKCGHSRRRYDGAHFWRACGGRKDRRRRAYGRATANMQSAAAMRAAKPPMMYPGMQLYFTCTYPVRITICDAWTLWSARTLPTTCSTAPARMSSALPMTILVCGSHWTLHGIAVCV